MKAGRKRGLFFPPLCGIIRAPVAPCDDPPQISYSLLRFDIKSRVGSRLKLWMEGTSSCTQARMGQKSGSSSSLWKTSISADVVITRHEFSPKTYETGSDEQSVLTAATTDLNANRCCILLSLKYLSSEDKTCSWLTVAVDSWPGSGWRTVAVDS